MPGTGFGPIPLNYQEVWAYAQATTEITQAWEIKTLIAMSHNFIAGLSEGEAVLSMSPVDQKALEAAEEQET